MITGKIIALTRWTFVGKLMSQLFNMLSRLLKAFLPRSKCLNFMAAITICSDLEPKKIKSVTVSIVSPSICHKVMGLDAMILVFWMLGVKPAFSLSSFTLIKRHFSVQFSRSVVSNSLWPHESHHTRPPCPSPTPGVYPNSCPSSQWCHPAMSSSVIPFSSCPQSLPASGSFPMSQLFTWGGQSTGVSTLASVLPNEHPGLISFRMDWLDFLAVQGTLKSLLQHHSSKSINSSVLSFLHSPSLTSIHDHRKNHSLD